MQKRIVNYIEQFNEVYNGTPWVDETFGKKLDPLTDEQAYKQAPGNNHSVADVVSHLIEWRHEVLRRLTENSAISQLLDESPNNWKHPAILRKAGWPNLYERFRQSHQQIIHFLEQKQDAYLDEPLGNAERTKEYFIAGLLQHDLYHLGQIGLILKWAR